MSMMGSHSQARKGVRHQVSTVISSVAPSLLPDIPRPSVLISGLFQKLVIGWHSVHLGGRRRQVTIDILNDDVLLEIFEIDTVNGNIHRWHTLAHVCRRWRSVVFASTCRLNLHLRCTNATPVRKMLDTWPVLPITIEHHGGGFSRVDGVDNVDNIVAALGHFDRVRSIDLRIPNTDLNRLAAAMKEPFPELTSLNLRTTNRNPVLSLPDSFLGESAPHLQTLWLIGISFPAIPNLLGSARNLVTLRLIDIPHSGYISPEAMATGLSALTRLDHFSIWFQSPQSRPGPSSPLCTRAVLPALNHFVFRGDSEYLEDLISFIDAPLLSNLYIIFFNRLIFKTPNLASFISYTGKLRSQSQARVTFSRDSVQLFHTTAGRPGLNLEILCKPSDWQLSSLAQVCDSLFRYSFNLAHLEICEPLYSRPHWQEDVENTQWLELLRPFTTVKDLSLSKDFIPRIVPALQELSRHMIMDVLPELQRIFLPEASLSGSVNEAFAQFVTARRLSGHPVAVNPQVQE